MVVALAYGIAFAATVLLALHVYRRLPAMPKRMPLGIGIDGRARQRVPRAFVWIIPGALALAVLATGAGLLHAPPDPDQQPLMTLVLGELAVVAGLLAGWWTGSSSSGATRRSASSRAGCWSRPCRPWPASC